LNEKYKVADDIHSESGSKWSITSLLKHLKLKGVDTKQLMQNVQDLITKTFVAVQDKVLNSIDEHVSHKYATFKILQ
jgi:hypothetical protein